MNIPLFDSHCDTLTMLDLAGNGASLRKNTFHVDLERLSAYSPSAQFFAIWGLEDDTFGRLYGRFAAETVKSGNLGAFCKNARDAENAAAEGRIAMLLSVEGAELIGCEAGLEAAYRLGVRAITLTWNRANELSGSCAEEPERGLSDVGKRFVRRCGELGIMTDLSHISDAGFWDAVRIAEKPVIVSHSNSRAVCPVPRNLTDDQFRAVRDLGGTAGINLYSEFVGTEPDIDSVLHHIDHFLSLGGEKNISIGCDFDGCDRLPDGISGVESLEKVYSRLTAVYGKQQADDIFYNNLMRVVRQICNM